MDLILFFERKIRGCSRIEHASNACIELRFEESSRIIVAVSSSPTSPRTFLIDVEVIGEEARHKVFHNIVQEAFRNVLDHESCFSDDDEN